MTKSCSDCKNENLSGGDNLCRSLRLCSIYWQGFGIWKFDLWEKKNEII